MTQNKLTDLNNILFETLEKLNDDERVFNEDNLEQEIQRSKAITSVAKTVIDNAKLMLDATKHADEYGYNSIERTKRELPRIMGVGSNE